MSKVFHSQCDSCSLLAGVLASERVVHVPVSTNCRIQSACSAYLGSAPSFVLELTVGGSFAELLPGCYHQLTGLQDDLIQQYGLLTDTSLHFSPATMTLGSSGHFLGWVGRGDQ